MLKFKCPGCGKLGEIKDIEPFTDKGETFKWTMECKCGTAYITEECKDIIEE